MGSALLHPSYRAGDMVDLNNFRPMKVEQSSIPSFTEFLHFARGDRRIAHASDYLDSISKKKAVVNLCFQELSNCLPGYKEEYEVLQKEGYVNGIGRLMVVVKYETFLNSIYFLMETIAKLVCLIYPKKSLPRRFYDQKDKFLKDKTVDPTYSAILEKMHWDDEVRAIRAEATHYLSGLAVSYEPSVPGYFNKPKSGRKGTPNSNIEIKDVISHSETIMKNLDSYLESFGSHFLKVIDRDVLVFQLCGITYGGNIAGKILSYNEKINGDPGICLTTDFDCPKADDCIARKKS